MKGKTALRLAGWRYKAADILASHLPGPLHTAICPFCRGVARQIRPGARRRGHIKEAR